MNTKVQKREETAIDYKQNIKQLLGWEDLDMKTLKTSAGMLKNFLKKTPVQYQRELRSDRIINLSAALRRKGNLLLGDAIVAATAISNKLILVSNDKNLARKVKNFIEVLSI